MGELPNQVRVFLGDWSFLVEVVVLIAVIAGPLLTAWATVLLYGVTRSLSRPKATLELILNQETHAGYVEQRKTFVDARDKAEKEDGYLVALAGKKTSESAEKAAVLHVLNRYELIAIGVSNGSLDEVTLLRWFRGTFLYDWNHCRPFVYEMRRQAKNDRIYREFERLAADWEHKKIEETTVRVPYFNVDIVSRRLKRIP